QGMYVLDVDRNVLGHTEGFACEGSSDGLVALAAGDAGIGVPIVALATTSGGRLENRTWLTLYRVTDHGGVQVAFVGEVERNEGEKQRSGTVTLIPGGLVYRDLDGSTSLWTYDRALGRYVEKLTNRPYA